LLAALLTVAVTPGAFAQEASEDAARSSARQLANEASDAYRRGDFEAAYDGFNRAFRLVGVPGLGVWSARSLRQLNRWVEASERYREVTRLQLPADAPESSRTALREAETELAELLPRIPSLVITLENATPEEVEVLLDGRAVPSALLGAKQRLDPGPHRVVARRGTEEVSEEVTAAERGLERITLRFSAAPTATTARVPADTSAPGAERTTQQTVGLVALGVGGVFLVGGAVTTVLALDRQADLRDQCTPRDGGGYACGPAQYGTVDTFETLKTISTVGLIGAGVLGAVGATLYLTGGPGEQPGTAEKPQVALWVGGAAAGLRGAF
jgi:hypothetical protein